MGERAHPLLQEDGLDETSLRSTLAGWWSEATAQPALVEPEAFAAWYEATHLSVFRYVYAIGGGPREMAEDLTAEAFLRAWKARWSLRGNATAATGWILRIARNCVMDDLRRQKRRPEAGLEDLGLGPTGERAPETQAIANEDLRRAWRLLQTHSVESREIVILRHILGWRVKDIAEHVGLPENAVSVNLHRSLERIRQQWTLK